MKSNKIGDNEMYSIDIQPLTTRYKKMTKHIKMMKAVGGFLIGATLVYALVILFLIVNVK